MPHPKHLSSFNTELFRDRLFRAKGEKTLMQFSEEIGLNNQVTLHKLLNYTKMPNIDTFYDICHKLGWDERDFNLHRTSK